MKLPKAEEAIIELSKLRDYCLDPQHPRGKHKARVFESVLGLTREDAEELRAAIASAILIEDCEPGEEDSHGRRFAMDFEMERAGRSAGIRTSWIIKRGEEVPRLTTCYVGNTFHRE